MSWKKEPLVHFLLLGAALFALSVVVGGDGSASGRPTITVTASDIEWLQQAWVRQWRRPPTAEELGGLIENHVREEILYREATEMGLDRGDTVIRRRLVQKIEFLTEDLVDSAEPTETEVRRQFEANLDAYREPERRSFTHIYFSTDERGASASADAAELLASLRRRAAPPPRAPELGDRFMMQYDYPRRSEAEVARHMGREFARRLFDLAPDAWHGPVESGYGVHLVRVSEVSESRLPQFEEVAQQVREDLLRQRREAANETFYEGLKQRYTIVVEESPQLARDAR